MRRWGPAYAGEGRLQIGAELLRAGEDYVVAVQGGDTPHVGAVALACPCSPPPNVSGEIRSFASVLTAPGHRDDVLARKLALRLCDALRRTVCLSVGIHADNATKEEISKLVSNANEAVSTLLLLLEQSEER